MFGASFAVVSLAHAQDPITFNAKASSPLPEVGARVHERSREEWSTVTTRTLDGDDEGVTLEQASKTTCELEREVAEVGDGVVVAWKLSVRSWRWEEGDRTDTSLTGQQVLLRRGSSGRFLLDEARVQGLSGVARTFLRRVARRLSSEALDVLLPQRVLKEGDAWEVDPERAAPFLLEDGEVNAERSRVEGRLVELKLVAGEPQVSAQVRAKLALSRLPGTDVPAKEGSCTVQATFVWPVDVPRSQATVRRQVRLQARGAGRRPDGKGYDLEVRARVRVERVVERR